VSPLVSDIGHIAVPFLIRSFEISFLVYFETELAFRVDRRHGIASAHAMWPSKASDVAVVKRDFSRRSP
jgi:hypothetical protein